MRDYAKVGGKVGKPAYRTPSSFRGKIKKKFFEKGSLKMKFYRKLNSRSQNFNQNFPDIQKLNGKISDNFGSLRQ